MKKKMKKAFTLVELLVVIAILAVLSTVAVIGYNSFTEKARISSDQQEVVQMNKVLQADEITEAKPATPQEVILLLVANGYNGDFEASHEDYEIVWLSDVNRVALMENNTIVYPEEYKDRTNDSTVFDLVYNIPNNPSNPGTSTSTNSSIPSIITSSSSGPSSSSSSVPSIAQRYIVEVLDVSGANNKYKITWNDDEDAITNAPAKENFTVNIGSVAAFYDAEVNDEEKYVIFNVVTGAELNRIITANLHNDTKDKVFTFTIENGTYVGFTFEDSTTECNHTIINNGTTPTKPAVPTNATDINVEKQNYTNTDVVTFRFNAIQGATPNNITDLVLTIKNGNNEDVVKNATYNADISGGVWSVQLIKSSNGPLTLEISFKYNETTYWGWGYFTD